MNPLKLTVATLALACLLVAVPYSLKYLASSHPAPGPERAAVRDSNLSDLPVDMPQSLLNVSRTHELVPPASTGTPATTIATTLPPPVPAAQVSVSGPKLPAPPTVATPKPEIPVRPEVAKAQELLGKLGYKVGVADGKFGQRTEAAMIAFQKESSLKADGQVTAECLAQLEKKLASVEADKSAAAKKTEVAVAKDDAKSAWDSVGNVKEPSAKEQARIARPARRSDTAPEELASARTTDGKTLEITDTQPGKDADVIVASNDGAPKSASKLEVSKPATDKADKSIAEAPETESGTPGTQVVMKVNADAGAPVKTALATPLTVSPSMVAAADAQSRDAEAAAVDADMPSEKSTDTPQQASAPGKPEPFAPTPMVVADVPASKVTVAADKGKEPAAAKTIVKVAVPEKEPAKATASAKDGKSPAKLKILEQQLAEAQAQAALVNNDSRYELGKYAPEARQAVTSLLDKVQRDLKSQSADPVSLGKDLTKLHTQMEDAKQLALSKKAAQKVDQIEEAYKQLKSRYAEQLKKSPLRDTVAKVDAGFKAMKEDYAKHNYDPIVERGDGFKLAIELLANDAAAKYLEAKLDSKTVRTKLSKSALKEIESLKEKKKYIEAVSVLDGALKTKTKSRSRRG
jgi:peptidoglycan hydrolase-like protein with peptidoglycan-binding domain